LTLQSLIAITTNIESREFKRVASANLRKAPENPRSGTTDDVECFFSVMRDMIGKDFTLKHVKFEFRKICMEFSKRIDPDLLYYYHTSSHVRFHEGPLKDFNQKSNKTKKTVRIPRREQPAVFIPGQATLPVRGSLSVRPQFHNMPLELPPPPHAPIHIWEHSYSTAQN